MLRLEETFSPEVLEITEELGGKAGTLEFLCRVNPRLRDYILPGTYIPFLEITVGKVGQVLTKIGKTIDDVIPRSTQPDDGIAFIGGIDNISRENMSGISRAYELTKEIENMKKKLVSVSQKEQAIEHLELEAQQHQEDIQNKYTFIFDTINDATKEWGEGDVEAHAITTMVINDLEGFIRVLDYHKVDTYIDADLYNPDQQVRLYPDSRKGYGDDLELRKFSNYFHDNGKAETLSKEISRFIDGKTKGEIEELITALKSANIPQHYSRYSSEILLHDIGVFTQDEIDEKTKKLEDQQQKHIGRDFLNQQSRLERYIAHNNLRGLDKTGLYIQEHLGESFDYGTMLEHPHISGKFIFSGREKEAVGSRLREAFPTVYMKGSPGKVLHAGSVSFPAQKLVTLYDEIKKTNLLIDDISLQVEFASKGEDVYILQVRAFRKNVYPQWEMERGEHIIGLQSIYGVTPEEGILVRKGESGRFEQFGFDGIDPVLLQDTKLAVTGVLSPFSHEMTELAYYPEVAIFGESRYGLVLPEQQDFRLWSNGRNYKIEQE